MDEKRDVAKLLKEFVEREKTRLAEFEKPKLYSIPYLPIMRFEQAANIAKHLKPLVPFLFFIKRDLDKDLSEADIEIDTDVYASVALLVGIFYFIFFMLIFWTFSLNITIQQLFPETYESLMQMAFPVSIFIGFLMTLQTLNYPSIIAQRKAKDVDKNLLYVIRHLTIQVRSGATLYDAMKSVAASDYGSISKDFHQGVRMVLAGFSLPDAIDHIAMKNKSKQLRKILWQTENAVRTGANIGDVLMTLSENYFNEQKVAIEQFGKDLSTMSMFFLVLTVIFPVMAVIGLVLSALLPIQSMPSYILYIFLGFIVFVQYLFLNYVREKRPAVHF
ncbi:MAG: type II secretion system F family protein [Candidatus Micrarchaeia archaeon]